MLIPMSRKKILDQISILEAKLALLNVPLTCTRCQKIFLRNNLKQTKYCSWRCARIDSANKANQRERAEIYACKINKIMNAFALWKQTNQREGLDEFIHAQSGVSRTFITRCINKGLFKCG